MSARAFETPTTFLQGPTGLAHRPILDGYGIARPETDLGEPPAPQAHPADEEYDDARFDRPPKKFELAGAPLARAEACDVPQIWVEEEAVIASIVDRLGR